jgi:hypothetical protein
MSIFPPRSFWPPTDPYRCPSTRGAPLPGAKDIVSCGAGVDTTYVDKGDVVASECEKVRRV